MNAFESQSWRTLFGLLVLLLIVSGCRTYGGQFDSEQATLAQIGQANQQFAQELERARNDNSALQQAASSNSDLNDIAGQFAAALEMHAQTLESHRELEAVALSKSGNHRVLHRTYGAIISGQRIVRDQYARVHAALAHSMQESSLWSQNYSIPHYYARAQNQTSQPSMTDLLQDQ